MNGRLQTTGASRNLQVVADLQEQRRTRLAPMGPEGLKLAVDEIDDELCHVIGAVRVEEVSGMVDDLGSAALG